MSDGAKPTTEGGDRMGNDGAGGCGRRGFLRTAGALGAGWAVSPAVIEALLLGGRAMAAEAPAGPREVDPTLYKRLPDRQVQCFICPLRCVLSPGQTCFCRTRKNHDGRLMTHAYGNPCILSLDPIEKVPLNHVCPGSTTLSVAIGGCNLRCLYCQNWQQSQSLPEDLKTFDLPPASAAGQAQDKTCRAIAFTYTEPVAFYEYMRDAAGAAKARKLRTVCATAGFIEPEPLRALCKHIDAFAVALKGFDEVFYEKVLGSQLKPVLAALETIKKEGRWLELTTLIIPTYNDDLDKIRDMCRWVRKSLGPDVPHHFARFVPEYKLKHLPRTPVQTLEKCREIAREAGLNHVYLSNVAPHEGNDTICPGCGAVVVRRLGFKVLEQRMNGAACAACRRALPGLWA